MDRTQRLRGLMLGTAVGDALGLPAEGLSRQRIRKWYGGTWRHRFCFGWGMVSDDTDHTVFVAQSLLAHPDSVERFTSRLGWCLRGWVASLPAGIGVATLRATLKLWIGFPPGRSGVFSAGNGPAMRSAPIGAFFAENPELRAAFVTASTRLTHTDPKAVIGARAVADIAAWVMRENLVSRPSKEEFLALLHQVGTDADWQELLQKLSTAIDQELSVETLADRLGLSRGVSGYMFHTVPVALYAWYRHFGDFEATLKSVLDLGGDTDTVAAITGALAGTVVGESGIPLPWRTGIWDWPRGRRVLETIADRLADPGSVTAPVRYFWPAIPVRNLVFLLIVLGHGFRRLAPPY